MKNVGKVVEGIKSETKKLLERAKGDVRELDKILGEKGIPTQQRRAVIALFKIWYGEKLDDDEKSVLNSIFQLDIDKMEEGELERFRKEVPRAIGLHLSIHGLSKDDMRGVFETASRVFKGYDMEDYISNLRKYFNDEQLAIFLETSGLLPLSRGERAFTVRDDDPLSGLLCFRSLAFCCDLVKPCIERGVYCALRGIDAKTFRRVKREAHRVFKGESREIGGIGLRFEYSGARKKEDVANEVATVVQRRCKAFIDELDEVCEECYVKGVEGKKKYCERCMINVLKGRLRAMLKLFGNPKSYQ